MVLRKTKSHSILALFAALQVCSETQAGAVSQVTEPLPMVSEQPLPPPIDSSNKKLRIRNFTEFMTPSFQGNTTSIPNSDGSDYQPSTLFNIFTAEYEFAPNYRVVYYQRAILLLAANADFQSFSLFARDPRFALRRTQIFDIPNLNTTYDLYFQPGISNNQLSGGNRFEVGFRTNTNFNPPGTRWTFGIVQEFTTAYLDAGGKGQRAFGWFMPWVGFDLSNKISVQHYTNLPFKNPRSLPWNQFQGDDQPPFMQNGVNYSLSKSVSTSVFLNTYLTAVPTLANSWASLWLSFDVI